MANAAQVLQQAHDLIEAGDTQAARQILDAVRSSNENNPDFWWVYAHALEDATEGKAAIERVRQLAPNYAGLETLTGGSPSTIKPLRPLAPLPPMGEVEEDDEFAETSGTTRSKAPSRITPTTVLAVVMVFVLIFAVLFMTLSPVLFPNVPVTPDPTAIVDDFATLAPTGDAQAVTTDSPTQETLVTDEDTTATEESSETEEEPTDTEVVDETEEPTDVAEVDGTKEPIETEEGIETEEAIATEEIAETEEAPTQEEDVEETEVADTALSEEVIEELEDFGVPQEGINEEESSLGQTLVVTTCATPGPVASQNIIGILNAFKAAGVELEAEALAFAITDCSDDSVILSLGISAEIVESYWLGDTTASELLAALRRI